MTDLPLLWWSARATGLVAEGALTGAVLCGLGVAGALPFLDRRRALELHELWTIAALILSAVHGVAIGVDARAGVAPLALILPFASETLRGAVALGTLSLWGLGVVVVSTLLRARVPRKAWRALHAVAYATFLLAVFHGLYAGSDASHPLVLGLHALALASVVAASVWRAVSPPARPGPVVD